MKKVFLIVLTLCLGIILLWGCGAGPGGPGSSGSDTTGIDPVVTAVTHSDPSGDQGDIWEIDLIGNICSGGTPEKWGNDYAHVTFFGDVLNPNATSNNELYITNYSVTFYAVDPGLPVIPQISGAAESGIIIDPGVTTGPFNFMIFDTGRKFTLQQQMADGLIPVDLPWHYNMVLQLWGQDKFGNSFTVSPIERVIDINDWDHC